MELMTRIRKWFAELLPARKKGTDHQQLHTWMQHMDQRQEAFQKMNADELKKLTDNELVMAVQARAERHVDEFGMEQAEQLAGFLDLSEPQRTAYTLYWYENEVMNGGLCQFLTNSSRMAAPYVSGALKAVGAEEHRQLFDDFIRKHEVDLDDLSLFGDEEEPDAARFEGCPFDEFDDSFYELETLEHYVSDYLKAHMDEL